MLKIPATTQKLRGGYYTPEPIATFLADWAIQAPDTTILEPSCGDGNILEAALNTLSRKGFLHNKLNEILFGVEIDALEADKTFFRVSKHGLARKNIIVGDFFAYCADCISENRKFNAIIGNPPFIRYQHFQEEQRTIAFEIMRHAGLKPSRLTNAWVPFLVASTLLLSEHGGRIGMVIPAELLQVNYAAELRRFLSNHYSKVTLLTFKKLVFQGIQQEVVLFLGEKSDNNHTGIRVIELDTVEDLIQHQHTDFSLHELRRMDHSKDKWVQYFLNQKEIDLLRTLRTNKQIHVTGDLIDVDVGIVTGLNDFFILSDEQLDQLKITEFTHPIVTRSAHLQGLRFTEEDFTRNRLQQFSCWLLNIPRNTFSKLSETIHSYIAFGESMGYNTGYKCRIREEWYVVPSVWIPDAFMLRQIHQYPKIILNKSGSTSTDTIHRVRMRTQHAPEQLTTAFINSMTFAFTEITGRSYGGGVLELEPNEAEVLPISIQGMQAIDLEKIHQLMLSGKIQDALDYNDKILLSDGLGLSKNEVSSLRTIWLKLCYRRINRKHVKK